MFTFNLNIKNILKIINNVSGTIFSAYHFIFVRKKITRIKNIRRLKLVSTLSDVIVPIIQRDL